MHQDRTVLLKIQKPNSFTVGAKLRLEIFYCYFANNRSITLRPLTVPGHCNFNETWLIVELEVGCRTPILIQTTFIEQWRKQL